MCGIAGVWSESSSNVKVSQVKKILARQFHRGPDLEKYLEVDDIVLGHNRLSIIDLSDAASQPMVSSCGRYIMVFNGEIYNYIELKRELDYPFETESDSEVLLAAYKQYGENCLQKLNGMFVFVIYDRLEKILFCARDRVGQKPFIYSEHPMGFFFASELSALLSMGIFSEEIDSIGVAYSYLRNYRHIPAPFTKFKQIRRLEPGHAVVVKNFKIIKKWCYWTPTLTYDSKIDKDDVYTVVNNAVKIRERADVPIGILLSGGVDSSIIAGLMSQHGLKPCSYTLKADDEEIERCKYVASHFNLPLKIYEYDEMLQDSLYVKMIEIYGEEVRLLPLSHAARLFREIHKDDIRVVMTGHGADEIFYGYDGANKQLFFSDLLKTIEFLPNRFLNIFRKIFSKNKELSLLFLLASKKNEKRKGCLYKQEAYEKGFNDYNYNCLIDFWSEKVKTKNYIDISNWVGLISENEHSITISGDLPAMLYSVETRSPFLDVNVIELALQIDAHQKISKKNAVRQNKLILKEAFESLIPKEILYAEKKGFGYGIR